MVHGSTLTIPRSPRWPLPTARSAMPINQLMLPVWLLPRSPESCRYWTNAFSWPISIQRPFCTCTMYIGDASGSQPVPDPSRAIALMSCAGAAASGCSVCACAELTRQTRRRTAIELERTVKIHIDPPERTRTSQRRVVLNAKRCGERYVARGPVNDVDAIEQLRRRG